MFIDSGKLDAKVPNETYFAKQFMLESYEEMQNEK